MSILAKTIYMNIMKYRFLLIGILSVSLNANGIQEYTARYAYDTDEISIKGIRKLEKIDENYILSFQAKNLIARMGFASKFEITGNTLVSKSYDIKIKPKFINRDQLINFNYIDNEVTSSGREEWSKNIQRDVPSLDPLNAQIKIRLNLMMGMEEFEIHLLEIRTGESENNYYKIIGNEKCSSKNNEYDCIVLKRVREREGRQTLYYLAPELGYMFIKIVDTGPERTQTLELIEILSLG